MKSLRLFSAVALLLSALSASAQESPFKFEFHGFVVGSMYYQDQPFFNAQGQGLTLAAPAPGDELGGDFGPPDSGSLIGGDVRQSRFSFGVTGPATFGGGTPRGYLELDFFGPTGGGNFGPEQALPRIRVALAEVKWGSTVLQVGQQNQLVVPAIPASISHIANPISYAAGTIGWRTPGVRVTHTMPAGPAKLELAAEVVKNKWADGANVTNAGAPVGPDNISLGEADGSTPMIQARVKADGKAGEVGYSAYLVGVYHSVDLKGMGDVVPPPAAGDSIDGYVLQVGGRVNVSLLTLAANFYVGNGTGNMLGSIGQFGDIADMGLWAQAGVNLTKEFSVWGTYGLNKPDEDDVRLWGGNRLKNQLIGGMVRYAQAGYQVGVEALQYTTTWATGATTDTDTKGLQIIGSAGYFF